MNFVRYSSFLRNDSRLAIFIHCHICQYRVGYPAAYFITPLTQSSLGIDCNVHRDGGAPNLDDVGVEAHHIADEDRLFENKGIYRHSGYPSAGTADRRQTTCNVYLRHDPAAEYIAGIISIRWHRHEAQYRILPLW